MQIVRYMILVGVLATVSVAQAQIAPFVRAGGNYSRYAMTSFNEHAPTFDASINKYDSETISIGKGFDGSVGLEIKNRIVVGVGYASFIGQTSGSSSSGGMLSYNIPGKAVYGLLELVFVRNDRSLAAIGGGFGKISTESSWTITKNNIIPTNFRWNGESQFVDAHLLGVRWIWPQMGVFGSAGYRQAKIEKLTGLDKKTGTWLSDGTNIEYDFSGPYASLGIELLLRK